MRFRSLPEMFPELAGYRSADYQRFRVTKRTVAIAMTARTGSTHLCDALARAGDFGRPMEIFNFRGPAYYALRRVTLSRRRGADQSSTAGLGSAEEALQGIGLVRATRFGDYLAGLAAEGTDAFVFKTSWSHFAFLSLYYRSLFPDIGFVYLDRRDTIAQAVSLFRAIVTDHWHAPGKAAQPSKTPPDFYNFGRLAAIFGRLQSEKADWETFFRLNQIRPLRLYYEDFSGQISEALAAISATCGIPLRHAEVDRSRFEKIADPVGRLWTERLRRDLAPGADAVAVRRGTAKAP